MPREKRCLEGMDAKRVDAKREKMRRDTEE